LYDSNQKTIYIGQKLKTFQRNISIIKIKKRTAWRIMRIIEIENSKRKKATESKALIEKKKEVIQEVTVQVEEIRRKRKRKIKSCC
jgi:DNA mismatch repair protein MutS2